MKEAAKAAIDQNYSHYTPVAGYDELLEAIVQKLKRDNDLHFTKKADRSNATGARRLPTW